MSVPYAYFHPRPPPSSSLSLSHHQPKERNIPERSILDRRPNVSQSHAVRVRVRNHPVVGLQGVDDEVDVRVDLVLVGARSEAGRVVDARKLRDPERLAVRGVVVQVGLDAGGRVLILAWARKEGGGSGQGLSACRQTDARQMVRSWKGLADLVDVDVGVVPVDRDLLPERGQEVLGGLLWENDKRQWGSARFVL